MAVNSAETLALGVAAWVTGSVALQAQTAANLADVAVEVFLRIGVFRSARPPDDAHPLGYGRERCFWSLFAALGILRGGGGLAIEGALRSALHPERVGSYPVAYLVLATNRVRSAGSCRCPPPVRHRGGPVELDRRRRRHVRRRPGRPCLGRGDRAFRCGASRALALDRLRVPHAGRQASPAPRRAFRGSDASGKRAIANDGQALVASSPGRLRCACPGRPRPAAHCPAGHLWR